MIAVIDFLQTEEANVPMLPAKHAKIKAITIYSRRAIHERPPTIKETESSGRLAIMNIMTLITAEPILPRIMADGDIVVVRSISIVFLSYSPDMDDAVIDGTMRAIMANSVIPTMGKKYINPLYISVLE